MNELNFSEQADRKISELRHQGITKELMTTIVKNSNESLYDVETGRLVSLDKSHNVALIYEKSTGVSSIRVVTVMYSSTIRELTDRRTKTGRWIWLH